jgi:hypothetical protein
MEINVKVLLLDGISPGQIEGPFLIIHNPIMASRDVPLMD